MPIDNIFWLDADNLITADGANVDVFTDRSPNGILVNQTATANQPNMNVSGPNGKREIIFNGTTDVLEIESNNNINTNTFARKDVTVAFSTGANVTSRQIIYEQGGSTRGLNMYIDNGEIHYHVWNNNDDNGANSAWGAGSATGAFFVTEPIAANTDYVATLSYEVGGTTGFLEGYLNSESAGGVATFTTSGVAPLLYQHSDNGALGGLIGSTSFDDNTSANAFFSGAIQEVVHFSEAPLYAARRLIVENHLASKYNISLAPSVQKYAFGISHEHEIAGIGNESDQAHNDARGTGIVRMNNASDLNAGEFQLWGHDNAAEAMQMPPIPEVIPDVDERILRVWRLSNTGGSIGTVSVTFYLDGVPSFNSFLASELKLLIDSDDGNFSNASQITAGRTYNSSTGELTFTGVTFNDGQWFTIGREITDLPVELATFTATPIQETALLEWLTVTEKDNDYFQLERSDDAVNYEPITKVKGMGTTTSATKYEFFDEDPLHGISYYRLKQVDFDGAFEYSDIVSVELKRSLDITAFPNPTSDVILVRGSDLKGSSVMLVSTDGRLLQVESVNETSKAFSLVNYPTGVYFLKVLNGERAVTMKVVKN
jgi:hypothetical protein